MTPKRNGHHDHGMPDPEQIKEILDVVSDRVPDLLKKLSEVLYGEDQAKKFGKAVAIFYNELKDTGMTNEQIFALTQAYMSNLNLGSMISKVGKDMGHEHHGHGELHHGHSHEEEEREAPKKKKGQ